MLVCTRQEEGAGCTLSFQCAAATASSLHRNELDTKHVVFVRKTQLNVVDVVANAVYVVDMYCAITDDILEENEFKIMFSVFFEITVMCSS